MPFAKTINYPVHLCAFFRAILFCFSCLFITSNANAQTLTWTGLGDGTTFSQAANWSPAVTPGSLNDCVIGAGPPSITLSANVSVRSLALGRDMTIGTCSNITIGGGLTLSNNAVLTINNTLNSCAGGLIFTGGSQILGGSGEVFILNSGNNAAINVSSNTTLTIASGITLRVGPTGSGSTSISMSSSGSLINQGTIAVRQASRTLTISGGAFNNQGTLEASESGARISIITPMNANNLGSYLRANGGVVDLPITLTGGTIGAATDGFPYAVNSSSLWTNVTVASPISIGTCTTVTIGGGLTLSNNAVVTINNTLNSCAGGLIFTGGSQILGGSGEVFVLNSGNNAAINVSSNTTLTIASGITVRVGPTGSGSTSISMSSSGSLINQGTIAVRQANRTLTISGGSFNNQGTLEASESGARISINTPMNANNLGSYLRANGGVVDLPITLTGGTLGAATDGFPYAVNSSSLWTNVTVASPISIGTCTTVTIGGGLTLSNNAVVTINNTLNSCAGGLIFTGGSQILGGSGEVFILNSGNNAAINVSSNTTLTIASGITLRVGPTGSGATSINMSGSGSLINQGTIAVRQASRTLTISGGSFNNQGTLEASESGARISIITPMNANNLGSYLRANGGVVDLPITLTGGTLGAATDGFPYVVNSSSLWTNVTVASPISIGTCATVTIGGGLTLSNNAILTINNTLNSCAGGLIFTGGSQILGGSGEVFILNSGNNAAINVSSNTTLTIASGITVRVGPTGSGSTSISMSSSGSLINQGTIAVRQASRTLTISGGAFNNQGTLEASESGARISINTPMNANNLGSYLRANGGVVDLPITLTGGTIGAATDGFPYAVNSSSSWTNVTVASSLSIGTCTTVTIGGGLTLSNNAVVTINNTLNSCAGGLIFTGGSQILGGSGEVFILNSGNNAAINVSSNTTLTIASGITLRVGPTGSGATSINMSGSGSLINQGTIAVRQASRTLTISGGSFNNQGTLEASNGAINVASNTLTNFSAGTLTGGSWIARGGALSLGARVISNIAPNTFVTLQGSPASLPDVSALATLDGTLTIIGRNTTITPVGGTLTHNGSLVLANAGASSGRLTITGALTCTPAASTRIELGGLAVGQFGRITATGNALVDGSLGGAFVSPYSPVINDSFGVVAANTVSGEFGPVCFDANNSGLGVEPVLAGPGLLNLVVSPTSGAAPAISSLTIPSNCYRLSTFEVIAGPADITYQWHKDGVPVEDGVTPWGSSITGASTQLLSITDATLDDQGDYSVTLTNSCGTLISEELGLSLCLCLECPADFNQDGGIDGSDIETFFVAWEAGSCDADTNSDGGVDGTDIDAFFTAWQNGGC